MSFLKKHPLIFGTIALTSANLICRFIGFFYRIYLSRIFGGEQMGIYQLIGPVMGITISITGGIFQTTISKISAEEENNNKRPLLIGLSLAIPLSIIFTIILYFKATYLATFWLKEPRCAPLISIFSVSIIPAAIHNCLTGFFLGRKKIVFPAYIQVIEQLFRTGTVICILLNHSQNGITPSLSVILYGNICGELSSFILSVLALGLVSPDTTKKGRRFKDYHYFLSMLLPLFSSRIIVNILQATETVLLPFYLKAYTTDATKSLTIYGTLTGMAFPLILFPTTLTGSLATILLPNLAALRAQKEYEKAQKTFSYTLRFCLFLGTVSAICFYLLADFLGSFLFDSNLCGLFIKTLAPLCPFLYMNTTLGGALHGLGKINEHFLIQVLSLGVRCLALPFLIPQLGITAYLYLLLFTSILQCSLSFVVVKKNITLS